MKNIERPTCCGRKREWRGSGETCFSQRIWAKRHVTRDDPVEHRLQEEGGAAESLLSTSSHLESASVFMDGAFFLLFFFRERESVCTTRAEGQSERESGEDPRQARSMLSTEPDTRLSPRDPDLS